MLLANEWQLGRVSGAILTATLVTMMIAVSVFVGELPLLQLGSVISQWLLPISLLATAIFVGWLMPRPVLRGELYREPKWLFHCWWIALRWLVPMSCVIWLLGVTV